MMRLACRSHPYCVRKESHSVKRWIPAVALLLVIAAVPALALDVPPARTVIVVSDVIKMAQAGVSDEAIIAYVHNVREPFDVNADDIIAMTNARVSTGVIKAVEDEAAAWKDRQPRRERETTPTRTVYVGSPYYDPWFYPWYGYYDPFFYGPRFSFGIGFGFGRFYGGHHFRRWH